MASGGHCYCRTPDIDSPLHYTCEKCKRKFHAECLLSGSPSVLQHDYLFHFKCQACGGGEEEFTRMRLQWMQVVQLTLYNLQLEGSGMCGYFRWKEHICSFIDKHWLTFFGSHRKKTSLWHGTVAGVLSSGCPGVFVSGAQELKETGWWKLAEPAPPTLNKQGTPVTKLSVKKKETPPGASSGEPPKEGLRSRRGKTSIQAAMELKAKRATLMEAKEIRKSKLSKSAETTPVKNHPSSSSSSSLLSEHLQSSSFLSGSSHLVLPDFQVPSAAKPLSADMISPVAFSSLFPNEAGDQLMQSNITGSLLAEHLTSSNSLLSSHAPSTGSLLAEHLTSGSLPSSHVTSTGSILSSRTGSLQDFSDENSDISQSSYLTERELRLPTTMPTLLMSEDGQDSDSDLEIDPGTMSPPAPGSPIRMQESPTVQELLSTMDSDTSDHRLSTLDDSNLDCSNFDSASVDTSYQGSVSMDTSNPDNTSFLNISNQGSFSIYSNASNLQETEESKVGKDDDDASVVDSETESESESGESDGDRQTGAQTVVEVGTRVKRKRKLGKENETEVIIVPEVKYHLMSAYEERLLLRKLEHLSKSSQIPHHINRLKCKLTVRQRKRENGVALFDLDAELNKLSQRCWGLQYGVKDNQVNVPGNHYHGDMRVLDKFQTVTYNMTRAQLQQQPSFLNRLVGTEDDQLEPVCSPYTARILKPFIRRDYESRPLKMRLLEEIKAYPHRSDPNWTPEPPPPIDYCYVRPQHIPSVNALCREFFWPGIDLSECLQYPDFSCVVLFRKIVIGFAFMVPDPVLRHNEAYISFIFTHPDWRRCGMATFMVYHLIQTCMGKDVTLHVSATNTAMLLYQKFGFKPEEFILDFYDKYYPSDTTECKHAFFLRLRR